MYHNTGMTRAERSSLLKFDNDGFRNMPEYKYKPLPSSEKRIRLLQLESGTLDSPEIHCRLIEADYNNTFHIPTRIKNDLSKEAVCHYKDDCHSKHYHSCQVDDECKHKPVCEDYHKCMLKEECIQVRKHEIKYEALSWCWGVDDGEYAVIIVEDTVSFRHRVRKDLALALKYLRLTEKARILWIDAICINQADAEERNQQVQMMSRIYTRSNNVCIWLGEDSDDTKLAIDFIKKEITQLKNFDIIITDKRYSDKWQALMMLMQREWFSRRWVVQEISLAKRADIHCGPFSITWKEFAVAVELFVEVETATHRLSEVMKTNEKFQHVPGWFEHVSELGASLLVQATGKVFRALGTPLDDSGPNLDDANQMAAFINTVHTIDPLDRRSLLSLEYLVTTMFIFRASECRDSIYSMLGIARDAAPFAQSNRHTDDVSLTMKLFDRFLAEKPFPVDYSRPYSDVCRDFVEFCIRRKHSSDPVQALDILCRPWALEPQIGSSIRLPKSNADIMRRKEQPRLRRKHDRAWTKKNSLGFLVDDKRTMEEYRQESMKQVQSERWAKVKEHLKPITKRNGVKLESTDQEIDKSFDIDLDLPSWVSRAENAPFELYAHPGMHIKKTGRANADPLVGPPQDGHRNYSAAQTQGVKIEGLRFRKRPYLRHYSLFISGFEFDEIKEVTDASQGGNIPKAWLDLGGWEAPYDKDPPDQFWRTIVADRGSNNQNPPYYYARACKESVNKGGIASGRVNTTALINNERNSIIAEFCRRVQAVIWGRSLFRTKNGKLGIASKHVRPGDKICILPGCTVPVVLGRRNKESGAHAEEELEDQLQAFKFCLLRLEDICVRKHRYEYKKSQDPRWEEQVVKALKQYRKDRKEFLRNLPNWPKYEEKKSQDGKWEKQVVEAMKQYRKQRKGSESKLVGWAISMNDPSLLFIISLSTALATEWWTSVGLGRYIIYGSESIAWFLFALSQWKRIISIYRAVRSYIFHYLLGVLTLIELGLLMWCGYGLLSLIGFQVHAIIDFALLTLAKLGHDKLSKDSESTSSPTKDHYYVFKGESYVHGSMDGEALRAKFYDDPGDQIFELR